MIKIKFDDLIVDDRIFDDFVVDDRIVDDVTVVNTDRWSE